MKYSKKDIKNITKNLDRIIFIESSVNKEEFKQIKLKGIYFPYLISSYGRVVSVYYKGIKNNTKENPKFLKPIFQPVTGYLRVVLFLDGKQFPVDIHRLVAEMFLKHIKGKTYVNHKDGDKTNNKITNLEWCTQKENIEHAWRTNLSHSIGEDNGNNVYLESDIIKVCDLLLKNKTYKEIYNEIGIYPDYITMIKNKKVWRHITDKYDFSNYNFGKDIYESQKYKKKIHEICRLLESNKYTMKEISKKVGVSYSTVKAVLIGRSNKRISKLYNIENFNNYEFRKRKLKYI